MKQELWRRMEELFHAALERPPEARRAFLDEACGEDNEVREQVAMLISKDEHGGSLWDKPLVSDVTVSDITSKLRAGGALVGRQFGTYRVLSLLGAGGMGEVYRAHDDKLGRDVAIKTLPAEFARNPARLARFHREARTLASLNHPNIAAIYGLEESPEGDCLILELVEGEPPRGPLPLAIALHRAGQVAEALEAAHAKGIIHRDLKPANVKVTREGRVKVLDFGLAKAVWGAERNPDLWERASVTGAETLVGHAVGTPGYMSPEQALGEEVDQRTDIWAFGCVLYELLTGRRAFPGETVRDTIEAVLEREPDWQRLPPKTPARIRELLRRCLQKDLNQRPSGMGEVRKTIEGAQRGWNRWRVTAVTVSAALGIVVVGAAWYVRGTALVAGRPSAGTLKLSSFRQLTDQPGEETYPSISPDGKSFVYASRASGNWDIYFQRVGGRNPVNLTKDSLADDTQPVFSHDGEQIAFRSERDGGGIFVMRATGESARRITDFGYNPAWSPDGTEIVCASTLSAVRMSASAIEASFFQ